MQFTKIQATGNDFIIIDNNIYSLSDEELSNLAKVICTRRLSIGADGLIAVDKSTKADIKMIFFNSDGSTAEMCGNGARCIARFAYENNLASECMSIETKAGIIYASRKDKRCYKIKMNNPTTINLYGDIDIGGKAYQYSYLELGNPGIPHAIVHYKDIIYKEQENIKKQFDLAKKIRYNKVFSKGANVSLYDIIDDIVYIKTYERGVENFTLACGTGATATAITVLLKNELRDKDVIVKTDGGLLTISIDTSIEKNFNNIINISDNSLNGYIINDVYLTGNTNIVAMGDILDENLNK